MDTEDSRAAVLISPAELQDQMTRGERVVLLDVRWSLAEPNGHKYYVAGHIPGAQFVDLDADLAAPPTPAAGRHPLPDTARLQQAARGWGIDDGDTVVVYDDAGGTSAARAWWLLRWGGVDDVRILDGGLAGWSELGGILEDGDVAVAPGNVTLVDGNMPVADADEAARVGQAGVLLDARAPERYTGDTEPVDVRAGHIPGAVNAPASENLDAAGARFRSTDELRQQYAEMGVAPDSEVVVYCGSGVTAAHEVAALESIGVRARLYPGSFSQWAADGSRPVATGLAGAGSGTDEPA